MDYSCTRENGEEGDVSIGWPSTTLLTMMEWSFVSGRAARYEILHYLRHGPIFTIQPEILFYVSASSSARSGGYRLVDDCGEDETISERDVMDD